ncbi:conserved membrane hypothetical protein [Vibrio crassostreae]|nr:conserved membrane hypothetical protein [Vibrio crassostreae]CAK1902342.1 conserved membrane hypothetical protein [Vibrio crassostreae]CAK2421532.1 conserved membrane hypothetical protein [Vibrio crassostreae]CAK2566536.1 conserved membrane hypothetical protein [Vibrio crassostreae]CAK2642924.1 conserved membrane hypothetical protein [Vibrio crassostreae]
MYNLKKLLFVGGKVAILHKIKESIVERGEHLFELYILIFNCRLYVNTYLKKHTFLGLTNRVATWSIFIILMTMSFESITKIDKKMEIAIRSFCTEQGELLNLQMPNIVQDKEHYEFLSEFQIKQTRPELVSLLFFKPIVITVDTKDERSLTLSPATLSLDMFLESCTYLSSEPQKLIVPMGIAVAYFDNIIPDVVKSIPMVMIYAGIFSVCLTFGIALINFKKITLRKAYEISSLLLISSALSIFLNTFIKALVAFFLIDFSIYNYGVEPNSYPFFSHNESVYIGLVLLIASVCTLVVFVLLSTYFISQVLQVKKRWGLLHLTFGYVALNVIGWMVITPILLATFKIYPILSLLI